MAQRVFRTAILTACLSAAALSAGQIHVFRGTYKDAFSFERQFAGTTWENTAESSTFYMIVDLDGAGNAIQARIVSFGKDGAERYYSIQDWDTVDMAFIDLGQGMRGVAVREPTDDGGYNSVVGIGKGKGADLVGKSYKLYSVTLSADAFGVSELGAGMPSLRLDTKLTAYAQSLGVEDFVSELEAALQSKGYHFEPDGK